MLELQYTSKFKKDYDAAKKRGLVPDLLEDLLDLLIYGKKLPEKTGTIN